MIKDPDSFLPGEEDSADGAADPTFAHAIAVDLGFALAHAQDLAHAHAHAGALARALALALADARTLARARRLGDTLAEHATLADSLADALADALDRARDLNPDPDLYPAGTLDLARDLAAYVERAARRARHLVGAGKSSARTARRQGFSPVGSKRAVPARSAVRVTAWVLRWLPAVDRPRYREEWVGELHEQAQAGVSARGQLGYALRLFARAGSLRAALRRPTRERAQ